ncbi:MAG: response regulator transcription factor [Candidatus Acidiferrales bacterium]
MTTPAGDIRILLVDDHSLFRESLARLLQAEPGFDLAAHCGSGAEALQILKSRVIDLVLLDVDLGTERAAHVIDDFRAIGYPGKILLVTAGVDESEVPDFIRKGIAGVFMKHNSPALLIQGIRETMQGKVWFEQDLLKRAFQGAVAGRTAAAPAKLTKREREVMSFVFEGLANKQIADRIHVSESAVKACLQQLFDKTGVRTRSQLVRVALERYRDEL